MASPAHLLMLLRHGIAEDAGAGQADGARRLTAEGKRRTREVAAGMHALGLPVDGILSSPLVRARQTAARLAAVVAPGVELEVSGLINPNDNPAAFDWQSGSWDSDTLVVGHLPFMARLVAHLVSGDQGRSVAAFRPGSVVCLQQDDAGQWLIGWMIRPELLGN